MRLQLADGNRIVKTYRTRGKNKPMNDAADLFGQIVQGVKTVITDPRAQQAAGQIIGSVINKKTAAPGSPAASGPAINWQQVGNAATGADSTINSLRLELKNREDQLKAQANQKYIFGAIGLGLGIAGAMLLKRSPQPYRPF